MVNGIRTSDPRGLNKGRVGFPVRQTPRGRRTYRPKRCGNNNKDEDNSPKTINDKNHQASSQKLRQQISCIQRHFQRGTGYKVCKSLCFFSSSYSESIIALSCRFVLPSKLATAFLLFVNPPIPAIVLDMLLSNLMVKF